VKSPYQKRVALHCGRESCVCRPIGRRLHGTVHKREHGRESLTYEPGPPQEVPAEVKQSTPFGVVV
jgi:hypothetical protein